MPAAVGYLGQDELGGHTFQLDNGGTLYSPDLPEARRLASALVTAPAPRLAQNAPVAPDTATDARPQAPESVADVPPASGATGEEPGVMRSGAMRAGVDTINPARIPDLPGVGADDAGTGLTREEENWINRPSPGSPAVTQAQLQAKPPTGTLIPSTGETTNVGAKPLPSWIAEQYGDAAKAQLGAHTAVAEAQVQRAHESALASRAHAEDLQGQLEIQQGERADRKFMADVQLAKVQQFDQDAHARYAEFGGDRLFKTKGTWATIGSAIFQGLGAYAAIVSGTGRNYAQEIINSAIDRDVQAQRDEYLRDRDTRNNMVADLTAQLGDVDLATQAAKLIQQNIAQAHASEMAALSKRGDVADNWVLWQADWQKGLADKYAELHDRAQGTVTTKTAGKYEYPHGATGGGPPNPLQRAEREAKLEETKTRGAKARDERAGFSDGGGGASEIAPGMRAKGGPAEGKEVRKQLADLDGALDGMKDLKKDYDVHPGASGPIGQSGIGGRLRNPFTNKPVSEVAEGIAGKKRAVAGKISELGGTGVINPTEAPQLNRDIGTSEGLQGVIDVLEAKRRAILRTHGRQPAKSTLREKK